MKKIFIFLCLLFFTVPFFYAYAALSIDPVIGLWKTEFDCALDFKADGTVSYINYKTKTGYSWKRVAEDKLLMRFSYTPSTEIISKEFTVKVDGNTMYMNNGMDDYVLKRSDETVRNFSGEIFYRERILLPPKVDVRYELYKNNEEIPFSMYAIPHEGKTPLPFSFDCLVSDNDKIFINATIYHENLPLFSTVEPVNILKKNILLKKANSSKSSNILDVPAKYSNEQGDVLYIEADGLAIVKKQEKVSLAHWALIDREHSIEITLGEELPITALLQDDKTLVARHYGGKNNVRFSKVENESFLIGKFTVHGTIMERAGKMFFADCLTSCNFPVQFPQLVSKELGITDFTKARNVEMDIVLSRNEEGGLNLYPVKAGADKTDVCRKVFQHATLENTYWRLTKLNGNSVQTFEGQREPHIIIRDSMLSGSDGCNNFFMPVELTEESIKVGQGGSTLMLCPQGDEQARAFTGALQKADAWQIKGSVLTLLHDNIVLALFEAIYL